MKLKVFSVTVLLTALLTTSACADDPQVDEQLDTASGDQSVVKKEPQSTASEQKTMQQVLSKIQGQLSIPITAIAESPVNGLLQLTTARGLFYASEDGQFLLRANVYNLDQGMRNETELAMTGLRLDGLAEFEGQTIDFKAENEKYVISVFTDITCGYCRKLHREIEEFNDLGITVRYLAFPRAGLNSQGYADMVSVWCAANPQNAMTAAKLSDSIDAAECANSVADQYRFGQQIGVTGTPNIIMPNGTIIPGYQPAKVLEQAIKDNS
ncbi:bifunctional protein-disulfide isomerase/oxidoreductase DsbC [Alteromonas sp. ASW11-36]|uniref:Thiol:disulfide interchange protein n=1 Tax=Alteromonas arenosi TaxID=3055817 RepID=A0ABT7T0N9_9ALTE|nr:bifunctional protein-disulfide isomerase/oxidoreductase DsbC [Alteromonas sp. ASW11-36]MDM7861814.1 bifunctional protein-disulfide isomerase/oxidoreductase DsbC [Alteromonas sp. ASW11-36]